MTRRARIVRNIAIGAAALLAVALAAALMIVRTDWFRGYVSRRIVAAAAEATGGQVEVGAFSFDPGRLRAVVTGFVIHGREPAGSPPYLRVRRAEVDLRLFASWRSLLGIAYLGLDRPEANIIVLPDGTTNVPAPKTRAASSENPLETVVNLAVGRFQLTNGLLTWNSRPRQFDLRANNLQVQLAYNTLNQAYEGRLSLQPLYVVSGRNTPVGFTISLPVAIHRDRIDFRQAKISTAHSQLLIDASVADLPNPKTAVHLNGRVALADLAATANLRLGLSRQGVPAMLDLDAAAAVAGDSIQVTALSVGLGHSTLQASGPLKGGATRSLDFQARLALGELGRLAGLAAPPEGNLALNGTARLDANNNYEVASGVRARDLSLHQGSRQIANISLDSTVHLDPHHLELQRFRLAAPGAEVIGDASIVDFATFNFNGNLRRLEIPALTRFLGTSLPYDGVVSGPISAEGNLKSRGTKEITARTRLSIAPVRRGRGIPVSGSVEARYSGATGDIDMGNSFLALPHTRIGMKGSLGTRLNIALSSRDLNDLLAASPAGNTPPIALNGGQLTLSAVVTGPLPAPTISGRLIANRLEVAARQFDAVTMDLQASPARATATGSISRGTMRTQIHAAVGLRGWKAAPDQALSLQASVLNGDLADALAIAGQPGAGYSGSLTADANVTGTIGNPRGTAVLRVANGTISGEPFDSLQIQVNMSDQLVAIPAASISSGNARLNLTADLVHPRDSFTSGQLHAHVQSSPVDLAQFRSARLREPGLAGQVQIDAGFSANLAQAPAGGRTTFLPVSVNGTISARSLRMEGQAYGDFTATARTSGQTVNYTFTSNLAGADLYASGNTRLTEGYPTTADVRIARLPVERILALAKQEFPAKGNLSGTAHFAGTTADPQAAIDLDLTNAVVYGEPLDHVGVRAAYTAAAIDAPHIEVVSGPSRLDLSGRFDHPSGNLQAGDFHVQVNSSRLDLARLRNVQQIRPGISGTLSIGADVTGKLNAAGPRVTLQRLNADVAARGITAQGRNFGDANLTAASTGGRLDFTLDSNLAGATIHGRGNAQLTGDYPVTAKLTFDDVAWTRIEALLGSGGGTPGFEAVASGQLDLSGPAARTSQLHGSLEVASVQLQNLPAPGSTSKPVVIRNQGPITATLDNGVAGLKSLHLTSPRIDLQASGTLSLQTRTANGAVKAKGDLGVLQQFSRDIISSGDIALSATVQGPAAQPRINGQLELHNASLNYIEIPNGITNANGVVLFNGSSATIRNLTAEVGGGKLTLGGYAALRDGLRFGLRANATNVRVRLPQGIGALGDANIQIAGGTQASMVTGTVTIDEISYAPISDLGSILSGAEPPVQSASAPSPVLENMKLDIQARTSPSLVVQADSAENLAVDANLRIRGTVLRPGVLGRISITQGKLLFFGSTYKVNTGTISFYNPLRVEPILNLGLETQAKGVDVVLKVTGPVDNMNLSYTSNPPLQFQEIVNLLATGKTPTSDPNLLVNQPSPPPQTTQQMGESAIVSKALADPVAGRLQRVFGVSQLSINPTFTGGSSVPQAQVTLQQHISSNMTFTYATALNDPNTQIIRVEWALNPKWSAIAGRDQNGIVSLRFLYKKQFH